MVEACLPGPRQGNLRAPEPMFPLYWDQFPALLLKPQSRISTVRSRQVASFTDGVQGGRSRRTQSYFQMPVGGGRVPATLWTVPMQARIPDTWKKYYVARVLPTRGWWLASGGLIRRAPGRAAPHSEGLARGPMPLQRLASSQNAPTTSRSRFRRGWGWGLRMNGWMGMKDWEEQTLGRKWSQTIPVSCPCKHLRVLLGWDAAPDRSGARTISEIPL